MIIVVGLFSFLSSSINNDVNKYLWVVLIDREKVLSERKNKVGRRREGIRG